MGMCIEEYKVESHWDSIYYFCIRECVIECYIMCSTKNILSVHTIPLQI
jgi:hypothetical protein